MAEWTEKMVEEIKKNKGQDMINKPPHYCREDAMECIDEMVAVFGAEIVANFCLCNVWKYRYRAGQKNGDQDIKKSDWYMAKYIQMLRVMAEREDVVRQEAIEPLTDTEQRIFLAAMAREEKICKIADDEGKDHSVSLVRICEEIERKVRRALWTI